MQHGSSVSFPFVVIFVASNKIICCLFLHFVDTDVLNNFSKVFPTVCKKKKGAAQSHSPFVKLTSSEVKLHS